MPHPVDPDRLDDDYGSALLTGAHVRLRPLTEDDLPVLDRWWQDPASMALQRTTVTPQPPGASHEMLRRWSANDGKTPDVGFSITTLDSEALVGHITLFGANWWSRCAELAVMLGPEHRGQGLGTDAIQVLLRYAFAELGLHRVELKVWAFNERALATYRKVGFVEEGRRRQVIRHAGRWHDEVLLAVLEHQWQE